MSNSQSKVLHVTLISELVKYDTMKYVSGEGGSVRLTAQKLDILGYAKPYYGLVNDKNLTKWMNQVLLENSIANIQAHDKAATFQNKSSDASALMLLSVYAKEKFTTKNGDMSDITKKGVFAILLAYYGRAAKKKKTLTSCFGSNFIGADQ